PVASLIRGFRNADVNPATTLANAAPMTTPTAISTTFPRRMNFLKPSSIEASTVESPMYDRNGAGSSRASEFLSYARETASQECRLATTRSDPHRHHNIPILIIVPVGGPQLPGGLRIFQLEANFVARCRFEELDQVSRVEADRQHFAIVGGLDRVLGLARFGRRRRKFHFPFFEFQ